MTNVDQMVALYFFKETLEAIKDRLEEGFALQICIKQVFSIIVIKTMS